MNETLFKVGCLVYCGLNRADVIFLMENFVWSPRFACPFLQESLLTNEKILIEGGGVGCADKHVGNLFPVQTRHSYAFGLIGFRRQQIFNVHFSVFKNIAKSRE